MWTSFFFHCHSGFGGTHLKSFKPLMDTRPFSEWHYTHLRSALRAATKAWFTSLKIKVG